MQPNLQKDQQQVMKTQVKKKVSLLKPSQIFGEVNKHMDKEDNYF